MKLSSGLGFSIASLFGIALFTAASRAQTAPPRQAAIDGVIAADAKVEIVHGKLTAGDGLALAPDGGLYISDVAVNRIYKRDRNGTVVVARENTAGASGLCVANDGRLLAAERQGKRIVAVLPDGSVTALASEFAGEPLRAPNDLIMDRKGGIYFTDPGKGTPEGSYVLYRRPSGELLLIDNEFIAPNGLVLSLDEKTLYVADLNAEYVIASDVQPDGSVTNRRRFAKLDGFMQPATALPRSGADGMAIDSSGRLYVTTDVGIQAISPRGENLGTIHVPTRARAVAFGGPGSRTLYAVADEALYRIPVLSDGPARAR